MWLITETLVPPWKACTMPALFFDGYESMFRTVVAAICAYAGLVAFLRISGKRTLTKMNAFDLVVTVALGSILATVILNKQVPLFEGLTAFAMLILLQYSVAWLSVRIPALQQIFKSEPTLLVHRGQMLPKALREQRIAKGEVLAAVRNYGFGDLNDIEAVVLETDGSISVVSHRSSGSRSTLHCLRSPSSRDEESRPRDQ